VDVVLLASVLQAAAAQAWSLDKTPATGPPDWERAAGAPVTSRRQLGDDELDLFPLDSDVTNGVILIRELPDRRRPKSLLCNSVSIIIDVILHHF
jgi:hypothetical protein